MFGFGKPKKKKITVTVDVFFYREFRKLAVALEVAEKLFENYSTTPEDYAKNKVVYDTARDAMDSWLTKVTGCYSLDLNDTWWFNSKTRKLKNYSNK